MQISEILSAERILCNIETSSKKSALEVLARLIAGTNPSLTYAEIFSCLFAREKLGSTSLGGVDDLGFACDLEELVLSRAKRALEAGCDGVISSGLEAAKLREYIDSKLLLITPGIRPVDNKHI